MDKKAIKRMALKDKELLARQAKNVKGGLLAGFLSSPEYFANSSQNLELKKAATPATK